MKNARASEQRRERMADFQYRLEALRDQEAASQCPEYAALRKIDRILGRMILSSRCSSTDSQGIEKARELLALIRHSWVPSILGEQKKADAGADLDDDSEVEERLEEQGGDL